MKLDNDGRKKLEAMKKALAAGVPLAGLLTAGALSAGCGDFAVQGRMPCPPEQQGERVVMGEPAVDEVQEAAPAQETPADNGEMETERIPYPPMSGAPVPTETDAPAEAEPEPEMKEFVTMGKPAPETVRQLMEQQADKCAPPAEEKEAPEEWVTVTMGEPAEPRIEPLESEDPEEFVLEGDIMVDDNPPPPPPDGDAP